MDLTKRALRDALGINDAGLAKFFNVTPSAVSQWCDDEPLPAGRQWQARALRPDVFEAAQMPRAEESPAHAEVGALGDSHMSKRALREKLHLSNDKHLAKVLGLPLEQVSGWADEDMVPALPQVMKLLGHAEQQEPSQPTNEDPDADRIGPIEVA